MKKFNIFCIWPRAKQINKDLGIYELFCAYRQTIGKNENKKKKNKVLDFKNV